MKSPKLQIIFLLLCAMALSFSILLTPTEKLSNIKPMVFEDIIPKEFDGWYVEPSTDNIIQSPEQNEVIAKIYSQVLTRTYKNKHGDRVMLSIAYTDNQTDNAGKQSHKPDICYPAQGFSIEYKKPHEFETEFGSINSIKMLAVAKDRVEPIIYWSTIGDAVANDIFSIKKAQIKSGLSGVIPDGIIFRVSTVSTGYPADYVIINKYIKSLLSSLSSKDRKRISGLN